jgi:4-amino-4-deoxy-L-arabinose transferase-like glycosyltransferase
VNAGAIFRFDRGAANRAPQSASSFATRPVWHRATLLFLLLTIPLRLKLLTQLELVPDEAYYWDWSRRLSWGYYDQGPMIAYVIRFTTGLFGDTEFGVRFGVCAASLVALWCSYLLARRLYSPLAGFLTVAALSVTPLMTVGSLIATYDPLLVCFWAVALVCLERALFASDPQTQARAWLWAGVAVGCGFLSKHTMLLLLPCLLLFLSLSPEHRRWLRRPQPYIAFAIAMLLYGGVFWWNAHHHWWTFGHLLFLAKKTSGSPLRRLGDFVGSQALLLGPGLFLGTLAAIGPHPMRRPPAQLFLICLGAPVLIFFCLMTFRAKVQANWAPCAWLTLAVLWAGQTAERLEGMRDETADGNDRAAGGRLKSGLAVGAFYVLPSLFLTLVLLAPPLRMALGVKLPPDQDVSNTAFGWRSLAAHVQQLRREMEAAQDRSSPPDRRHGVFIAGNGYQYAAEMAFYLPDHPETFDLYLHFRLTMYAAYVERLKDHLGEDCLFINSGQADDRDLRLIFEDVEWQPPFDLWRRPLYNRPIASIHIAKCRGYRRYVGLQWAQGG